MLDAKVKDTVFLNDECSQKISFSKKKVFEQKSANFFAKFYASSKTEKVKGNFFLLVFFLSNQKIVLSSAGQGIFENYRLRGQELELQGQGHGLQYVSSRPRTSSRTPPLKLIVIKQLIQGCNKYQRFGESRTTGLAITPVVKATLMRVAPRCRLTCYNDID